MPQFRIHRMKDPVRETFRWAPHVSAQATVKFKDYEAAGVVDARHEYEAWVSLRTSPRPLQLGDLLETETGDLRICKYVGFETAVWFLPEPQPERPSESEAK